jgi:hypothetical protein
MTYGKVLGASSVPVVAATVLPNTGSSMIVTTAVSVALGLIVWGGLYTLANK